MTNEEIRTKVAALLGDIVDMPELKLSDATTADEVDGWDSINHVKLIVAIEKEFKVKFTTEEISAPESVGQLVSLISSKCD